MVRFKAPQAKMALSICGKLIRFGVDGIYTATDKDIIAKLDSLSKYVRVDLPAKNPSNASAPMKKEAPAKEEASKEEKPSKKKGKKKD